MVNVELAPNVILVIEPQLWNALLPILVTESEIAIVGNPEQLWNTELPILVILLPIVTLVIAFLQLHAFVSIDPT